MLKTRLPIYNICGKSSEPTIGDESHKMLLTKNPTNKPTEYTVDNIPAQMARLPNWNLWKAEKREKIYAKVPYNLNNTRAKSNQPQEWQPLAKILPTYLKYQADYGGLTFLLKNNSAHIMVLDIDYQQDVQLITVTRVIPVLTELLQNAYIEDSPSGHGCHIYFIAEKPSYLKSKYFLSDSGIQPLKDARTIAELEFYDFRDTHTMSVTGNIRGNRKDQLTDQQDAFNKLTNIMVSRKQKVAKNAFQAVSGLPQPNKSLSDDEIIALIKNSSNKQTQEVADLLANGSDSDADESRNDFKVACELAFYTRDAQQIERIMKASALNREKFNRKDYLPTLTIRKAIKAREAEGIFYGQPTIKPEMAVQQQNIAMLKDANVAAQRAQFENYIATKAPVTSTGISNLDQALDGGLRAGLYILGAVSSIGKTSLMLQIADTIALNRPVLYISMEMSRNELIAKSISRLTKVLADKNPDYEKQDAQVSSDIVDQQRRHALNHREQKLVTEATDQYYATIAKNMYIVESVGKVTAATITSLSKELKSQLSDKTYDNPCPVVVVDYLQILAPINPKEDAKRATDTNVVELKRLSRDLDIPVLAISSFNRENYNTSVSMSSFKESGAIEYGSDVLLGMQFANMRKHEITKNGGPKNLENKQWLLKQRKANQREIELIVLKNRNGRTGQKINLEYNTLFNYFKPQSKPHKPNDQNGLVNV